MACLQVFSRSPVAVDGTVCTKPGACPCRHLLNRRLVLQHKKQLKRPYYLQTAQAAVSAPTETLQAPQQSPKQLLLPDGLNKHVVQLIFTRDNKPVHVYILGMSHVSRHSCTHVSQLIATVKPELVLLELCKDRVGLLIDPELPQPLYWHSRSVRLECSTAQQPSVQRACDSLLRKLQCQPGKAFSAYQIEQDCAQLLSSGLFKSVVPVTQSASATDAPMFVYSNNQVSNPVLHMHTMVEALSAHAGLPC